MNLSSEADAN